MAGTFFTIVTDSGTKKMLDALDKGKKLNITEFAVGDGGGRYYIPESSATELKNEVWRGAVNSCYISEESENLLVIESVIPTDIGGFTIREMGVFDKEGTMIAVCNTPDTQKVKVSDGVVHELDLSMELALANTDSIELIIDPTVIMVTKKDIERLRLEVNAQIEERDETLQAQIEEINSTTYKHGTKVLGDKKSALIIDVDTDIDMDKSYLEYDPSQGYDPDLHLFLKSGLTFDPDTQTLTFKNINYGLSADDFRNNSSSSGQSYWSNAYSSSSFFLSIYDNSGNTLMYLWVSEGIEYKYGFNSTFSDADDFISQITEHGATYGKSNRINNYYAVTSAYNLPVEYRTLPPVTVNEQHMGFLCDKERDGYIEYILDCINGKNLLSTRGYDFQATTDRHAGANQTVTLKAGTKYRFSADIKVVSGNNTQVSFGFTDNKNYIGDFGSVKNLTIKNGKVSYEFITSADVTSYVKLHIYNGYYEQTTSRRIVWENIMLKEIV